MSVGVAESKTQHNVGERQYAQLPPVGRRRLIMLRILAKVRGILLPGHRIRRLNRIAKRDLNACIKIGRR